jgi:uncharacterized membrane protein
MNQNTVWKAIFITLLILSIVMRFINLDYKLYWADETFTLLRVHGHTKQELVQAVINEQVIPIKDLQKFQTPSPDKNIVDVIKGFAIEDPKHTPLYFIVTHLWVNIFGTSATVIRSLSAIFSTLTLLIAYWFCIELFESSFIASVATILIAVSPFHILFAQEARMYSLHILTILLSSAALLRAIRHQTKQDWFIYSGTLIFGLYTHLIFGFVAVTHGIYVLFNYGIKNKKTLIYYLQSTSLALLAFSPWLFLILSQLNKVAETVSWINNPLPFEYLLIGWQVHFSRLFFDIRPIYLKDNLENISWWLTIRALILLTLFAVYFLRKAPKKTSSFLWLLTFIPVFTLAIPDLIFGGTRSNQLRYSIIPYLGYLLIIAYMLGKKAKENQKIPKFIRQTILTSIIIMCIMSWSLNFQQKTWWNKYFNSENPQLAEVVNTSESPLIVCVDCDNDWGFGNLMSWSYLLDSKVKFQAFKAKEFKISKVANNFANYFLFNASEQLRDELVKKHDITLKEAHEGSTPLWKIENFKKLLPNK